MSDVKDKVRKLMAVAGDGVASEAEIETAMRLAAKLMDAHHLTHDDVNVSADEAADARDMAMGRVTTASRYNRLATWECALANAILDLIGTVKHYRDSHMTPVRHNGMVEMANGEPLVGQSLHFYGPADDAREAAELFAEWGLAIATMAMARWGGAYRGDGAQYAAGFATALRRIASKINADRAATQSRPIPQLTGGSVTGCTAITLTDRMQAIKVAAGDWLKKTHSVNLVKGSRGSGYSGSMGAYHEGMTHGAASGFVRKAVRRALGSGR